MNDAFVWYHQFGVVTLILNTFLLLANLMVFGLSIKLYTEIMKDKNMEKRNNRVPFMPTGFQNPPGAPPNGGNQVMGEDLTGSRTTAGPISPGVKAT